MNGRKSCHGKGLAQTASALERRSKILGGGEGVRGGVVNGSAEDGIVQFNESIDGYIGTRHVRMVFFLTVTFVVS